MLVNLQPCTSDMPLEAWIGDDRRSIGDATDSPEMRKNMYSALAAIDGVGTDVAAGWFWLYDVNGRRIRQLANGMRAMGPSSATARYSA